ncbi:MAG: DUF1269 domain-containing protein [Actinobacteria bacterium]|nr:DUF1269 domain-containing protein [Actinomycetota bacterium]
MSRFEIEPSGAGQPQPQTLVGLTFADHFRAQEFLTAAQGLAAHGRLVLRDAVIVARDDDGRTMVHETIDPQPGRSALSGAMWAGLVGLIVGGPVGWIAGMAVGAGAGAVTAKVVDLGISDEWVEWFRTSVQPGRTIVALLVEDVDRNALVAEASRFTGAELVYANLDEHTLERIRSALGEETPGGEVRAVPGSPAVSTMVDPASRDDPGGASPSAP